MELGLLAMAEIPLYFWYDTAEPQRTHAARTATAIRQLERLIAPTATTPA